jgi:hypothetical protein
MVLAGYPERLVDLGAGLGDFLMPVTIKSVDRLMDRQRRRIGRDEGNIAAAAIGPPAAFVTRLWFVSLSLVARFSMRSEPRLRALPTLPLVPSCHMS